MREKGSEISGTDLPENVELVVTCIMFFSPLQVRPIPEQTDLARRVLDPEARPEAASKISPRKIRKVQTGIKKCHISRWEKKFYLFHVGRIVWLLFSLPPSRRPESNKSSELRLRKEKR